MRLMNLATGVVHEVDAEHERTGQARCGAQGNFVELHKLASRASECPRCFVGASVHDAPAASVDDVPAASVDDVPAASVDEQEPGP